jgi:GABA(A) receptor-associated protein
VKSFHDDACLKAQLIRIRLKSTRFDAEQRQLEANSVLKKYPDRVPLIVQRAPRSSITELEVCKFLVPREVTVAQFIWILRQRLKLDSHKAVYLFVQRTLPQSSALLGFLYDQCHDQDGFLYAMYSGESTFGSD